MTATPSRAASRRRLAAALAAALVVGGSTALVGSPAYAGLGSGRPAMTVSATTVPSDRPTDVTARGTDYLVPPHDCPTADVFGGVYVMFGWVASPTGWGPSARNSQNNAGVFGYSYAYPGDGGDASLRDDGTGRVRLVSFTSGGESGAATSYHMDCNGDWSAPMTVHSPVFQYTVPSTGEVRTVDCRALTSGSCGIFTIGAHGKASATNEVFVPVTFTATSSSVPVDTGSSGSGGTVAETATSGDVGTGAVDAGAVDVVEEVVDVASPFAVAADTGAGTGAGGFAEVLGAGATASGVPGAAGAPVAVAVAGSDTFALEPTAISNTGRLPRWLLPTVAASILVGFGAVTWYRRRRAVPAEVIA